MIDAVLVFGLINIIFEMVLLGMLAPRTRLRVLGSPAACTGLHVSFLTVNMVIHWGTLIGTMSAILAFVSSILTVAVCKRLWGFVVDDRFYTVGIVKYSTGEIK